MANYEDELEQKLDGILNGDFSDREKLRKITTLAYWVSDHNSFILEMGKDEKECKLPQRCVDEARKLCDYTDKKDVMDTVYIAGIAGILSEASEILERAGDYFEASCFARYAGQTERSEKLLARYREIKASQADK